MARIKRCGAIITDLLPRSSIQVTVASKFCRTLTALDPPPSPPTHTPNSPQSPKGSSHSSSTVPLGRARIDSISTQDPRRVFCASGGVHAPLCAAAAAERAWPAGRVGVGGRRRGGCTAQRKTAEAAAEARSRSGAVFASDRVTLSWVPAFQTPHITCAHDGARPSARFSTGCFGGIGYRACRLTRAITLGYLQITLEDDTDPDEASDGDTEEGGARRGGAEQPSQDSLRLSPTPASLPQPAQLDPETQRLLERNKKALDALEKAAQEEPIDLISSSDGAAGTRGVTCLAKGIRR